MAYCLCMLVPFGLLTLPIVFIIGPPAAGIAGTLITASAAALLTRWYSAKMGLLQAYRWQTETKLWVGAAFGLFAHLLLGCFFYFYFRFSQASNGVDGNYFPAFVVVMAMYLINFVLTFRLKPVPEKGT